MLLKALWCGLTATVRQLLSTAADKLREPRLERMFRKYARIGESSWPERSKTFSVTSSPYSFLSMRYVETTESAPCSLLVGRTVIFTS
jgi:hypothetical protein